MPLPNVNDFIGTNVTQGKFKQAQKQLIEYVEQLGNNVSAAAGGKYGFNTIADFEAVKSSLPNNSVVNIASGSDAGDYVWNGSILTKSPNDSLTQSKKYTDDHVKPLKKLVGEAESELLEVAEDRDGFAYRTTDANGNVRFAGERLSFSDSGIEEIVNGAPLLLLDKEKKVVLYIDKESNLHVPNGIFYGGGSLDENLRNVANDVSSEKIYRKIAGQTYQNAVISKQQPISQFASIMTLAESNGLRNRMIAGVKISTGLFVVWHQQTKYQYDGDG